MLLPHGMDGQGPEHSSSRIERFLELCDEDESVIPADNIYQHQESNWSVVNCTTAAQYFHVLRRQLRREFRKPLVVIAPKKMLKSRDAMSSIEEFGPGLRFHRVLDEAHPEKLVDPKKVKKVLLMSGQVHYDLVHAREKAGIDDIALVRIEELHPFPYKRLAPVLERYPNAKVEWVQEEHRNQGPWKYVQNRVNNLL
jgi:2-oxoglutarate dehydrogenase E1 component